MKKLHAVILGTVVIGGAVVLGALTTPHAVKNVPVKASSLPAYAQALVDSKVKAGDCLVTEWQVSFKEVPCSGPHTDEVYSVVEFNTGSFETDASAIPESFNTPVTYASYLGGELPADGLWRIGINSFLDNKPIWDAGFHKAIYTVVTDKAGAQEGTVAGTLAK